MTTDMATSSGNKYIQESAATMVEYGEEIDSIDFCMLLVGKDAMYDDEEERESLIKANCLYEDGEQPQVGASGSLVCTGASDASSVTSKARSSSYANVRQGYRIKLLDMAKEKGITVIYEAALRKAEIDPTTVLHGILASSPQAMDQDSMGDLKDNAGGTNEGNMPGTTRPRSGTANTLKYGVQFQNHPRRNEALW